MIRPGRGDGGETLIAQGCVRWMRTTGNKKMGDGNFFWDESRTRDGPETDLGRTRGENTNMNLPVWRRVESSKWPKVASSAFWRAGKNVKRKRGGGGDNFTCDAVRRSLVVFVFPERAEI